MTTPPAAGEKATLTDKVLLGTFAALSIYELWTFANRETNDTLSDRIRRGARKRIYLTFFAGLLCGHWFWPLDEARDDED